MLREISKMEQRYDAVMAVMQGGFSVTEAAQKFGVSRESVYRWMKRYEEGGLEALAEGSHRPKHSPLQTPAEIETRVVEMRRQHPLWGPLRIQHQLQRQGVDSLPSHMAIYRALVRHGLIEPGVKRKKLPTYKRWERGRSMELWQMDVVGGVLFEDGSEAKILTGLDDHSRFCICCGIMMRATTRPVCEFFAAALERHGVPEEILTDNGKVFTNRFGRNQTEVLFDKICRENGITHRLTAPRSPTTTGKIERFHRSLRREFLTGKIFSSLEEAQRQLNEWVLDYNTNRPHQGIAMATPLERFSRRSPAAAPALDLTVLQPDRSGDDWVSRTVSLNGTISVANQVFSVGKHRSGTIVDIRITDQVLETWDGNELLKAVLRQTKGVIRKKRAEVHGPHPNRNQQ
jgi:transposase InsO family protein